jgi:superfamily II DNA or RNA helicase/diadenosine tetraphosphate (Ap4A) HIT family hydrolase
MSSDCIFCQPDRSRIAFETDQFIGLWDGFPVSPGHLLVIPRRHIPTWYDATAEEQVALLQGIEMARQEILRRHQPDGFNIGINIGAAAGQTVFHLHIHLIPRYSGDLPDPRGGVRNVIPSKGNYFRRPAAAGQSMVQVPHDRALIHGGGDDPLLPHFLAHLNRATGADLCVAFVRTSGLDLIIEHLRDLLDRGGNVRLLTGDYLDITEPEALLRLTDLGERLDLRVFETLQMSFHPKGYLFHFSDGTATALVGSSNLSDSALRQGIEWNYRVLTSADPKAITQVQQSFDQLFQHPATRPVTPDWIREYTERRKPPERSKQAVLMDIAGKSPPPPHSIQREALVALEQTRREGNSAGLVVLATGLGKTWLSAFDSCGRGATSGFRRILFVAHRDEILTQARATFRRIRPSAVLGNYTGTDKAPDADVLFASIQTLGQQRHLKDFERDRFDYIIVDEFHHASAATYRNLIAYFTPKFLLGLTATPERTDGGDLLGLCQENLVYRCDLARGIRQDLLAPFHYFGVPDEVDYQNIPWRNHRFDEAELTRAVATEKRAQNALDQLRERGGKRTIAFCCSQRHSDFMAEFFSKNGCRAVAVHSGENSAPRAASLEALEAGRIDVVCAVDMFNEGVDIPNVDTVMMLRPTESSILWMQQFGRGLRKSEGKPFLTVIDYIGNHRSFLSKPRTLLSLPEGDQAIDKALNLLLVGGLELPPGCEVTYDLQAIDILRDLLRKPAHADAIQAHYLDFRERHGQRPTAAEMFRDGFTPRALRVSHGSWLRFVKAMGDLSPVEVAVLDQASEFLGELESTRMTKSFKILTLLALLDEDQFPGSLSIEVLEKSFRRRAERSAKLRMDVGPALADPGKLTRMLEVNPINAWTGDGNSNRKTFFSYRDRNFASKMTLAAELRNAFQELVRELADWRLAEYLDRGGDEETLAASGEQNESGATGGPALWHTYLREKIPPMFGRTFSVAIWNAGFVASDRHLFLLVTLEKDDLPDDHGYEDKFLSADRFQWKSQNSTTQQSKRGQLLRHHVAKGLTVHLFVRRSKKIRNQSAAFYYCGEVTFESWQDERPITINWQLSTPVPDRLHALFKIGG